MTDAVMPLLYIFLNAAALLMVTIISILSDSNLTVISEPIQSPRRQRVSSSAHQVVISAKVQKTDDEENLPDPEKANDENVCSICLENKKNIVVIPCGHTFCSGCLKVMKIRKEQNIDLVCPSCRSPITRTQVFYT